MISRSPVFIYKPYYCVVSSTFYQHVPLCWSSINKKFLSSTAKIQPKLSEIDNKDIDLIRIGAACSKFDIFNATKFIGKLNNNNYENIQSAPAQTKHSCLVIDAYPNVVINHRVNNSIHVSGLSKPVKINSIIFNKITEKKGYIRDHDDDMVNISTNTLSCENGKRYWKDGTKIERKTDSDLPSEAQLDEMMSYFYEQAPKLFTNAGWSYNKCSYKIHFENMMLGTTTNTLNAYIMQINIMKNLTKLILSNAELSIIKMTKDVERGSLQIRWQVQGVPRYILPFSLLGIVNERRSIRYIDGFSIFYMKNDGLYHRHLLLKMTPLQSELRRPPLSQVFPELYGIYRPPPPLRPSLEINTNEK